MSEGTPGHGPDADSRTGTGDGQAPADGRPAVPPVRYGPRNGSPANGTQSPGSNGRTTSGAGAPQQHRPPQPPRTPATGPGANGAGANGAGSNGRPNGAGANGSHPVTPNPYARPRPNATPARPEPSEQERLVAEARTAAAARNASASKVRGGSALSGTRSPAAPQSAPADETTVMPVVAPDRLIPATPAGGDATTSEEAVAPEKGRNVLGRLRDGRDRRASKDPQDPQAEAEGKASEAGDTTVAAPAPAAPEQQLRTEPVAEKPGAAEATEQEPATEERRLTWRDRLGLAPKERSPEPTASPDAVPDAPTDAAATTSSAPGSSRPEARTPSPAAPPAGQPGERVTPTPLVASNGPDTAVIPAVEPETAVAGAPVTAGSAQTSASAKPKVGAARRTRKARLRLSRVDPWSVMKTALLFSIAAGIILVVATYGVWSVLNASGLFDAVNDMVKSVVSTPGDTTPFRIEEYVNTQKIIGVAALIAVVDVLIFTALATLGSFLYNLAATVLGGLEVTLAED